MQISLLAMVGLASAASVPSRWASVWNKCDFDVTVHTAGSTISAGEVLQAGRILTNGYPKEGEPTNSFIITRNPDGLAKAEPQTIFSFSVNNGKVSYDVTDVYGDAFKGFKVEASANDASCPKIQWDSGIPPPGNHAGTCSADVSIAAVLCL